MSHEKNMDTSGIKACKSGWSHHEDIEEKLSAGQINSDKSRHTDVNGIDWCELTLCNAMGFSRFARQCDDKSLNILFCKNVANNHVVSTHDTFVEVKKIQKRNRKSESNIYNSETNRITEIKPCIYGLPDTLFLTQIFNPEKYDRFPNNTKKMCQIFSARGMFTTSLYTKKLIPNYSDWNFCRRCETTIDFSRHSPGDYKHILINSKLLCIIAFDIKTSPQFRLSFRRITGDYLNRYSSDLIGPSNDCMTNGQLNCNNVDSNVDITQFGISLRNCEVFGMPPKRNINNNIPRVSLKDLSSTVFDCVLLDINNRCDSGDNNIILTLLLICKALPHVDYCFEFIQLKIVFSYGYKNFLSCFCQRDTNVSINNNVNLKKMFNQKNQSLLGWNNKVTTFKAECIKINDESKKHKVAFGSNCGDHMGYNRSRLVIIVVKTTSHHIILYNYDLNNYVILKLNCSINGNIYSNKTFPYVCTVNIVFFLDLSSFVFLFCLIFHFDLLCVRVRVRVCGWVGDA